MLHMRGEEGESAEGSSEDSHALLVKQLGGSFRVEDEGEN